MSPVRDPLWRSFPWDPAAAENQPFSAAFVPPGQGHGRFDLPGEPVGVLYLAETPDHAVAEWLARFRGTSIEETDLMRNGKARALVAVELAGSAWDGIADLCAPAVLQHHGFRPDSLAMRDRTVTQAVAAALYERGLAGLRWWSALFGDWHTVVLFRDKIPVDALVYGAPEIVGFTTHALARAADWLNIQLARGTPDPSAGRHGRGGRIPRP